jgi:ketosteroid isomerase-like protein
MTVPRRPSDPLTQPSPARARAGPASKRSGAAGPAPNPHQLSRGYCAAVSQENVDKARAFIEAYNRRDFDAAVESFDPEIEWVLPPEMDSDSGRGPDEVKRFFYGLDETFDVLRLEPQEFVDAGDHVATRLRHYGRGKGSGVEIDEELYHQVATFREGRIVRMEYFSRWSDALEAAGLRGKGLSVSGDR